MEEPLKAHEKGIPGRIWLPHCQAKVSPRKDRTVTTDHKAWVPQLPVAAQEAWSGESANSLWVRLSHRLSRAFRLSSLQ